MRRARLGAISAAALLAVATHASADRRDPTAAEALFRAARASVERGDYASACAKFEESNRLDPTVGTVFNLADCNEHLGLVASAWQLFKEAAQRFATTDDRMAIANARAARLEPRLPRMVLRPDPALPREAVVRRDGVQLGSASFGLPLPVDPGDHVITVELPGRQTSSRAFHIGIGESREVPLELGAATLAGRSSVRLAPSPASETASPSATGDGRKTWGIVLLGAGGVGIATSLVLGGLALSEKHTVESSCVGQFCNDDGLSAARRGRLETTAGTIAFGAGALAAGVGTYFLLSQSSSTAVSGSLVPGSGFVTVTGRFY